jgi:hypothetical protein
MKPKKLSLERETLAPLSPSDLAQVNGGDFTDIVRTVTRYLCPTTTTVATRLLNCNGDPGPQAK